MDELPDLVAIGRPECVALGRSGPVIADDEARKRLPEELDVPEMPRRQRNEPHFVLAGDLSVRSAHLLEVRRPEALDHVLLEIRKHRAEAHRVSRPERDLLAPVAIEQVLAVERHRPDDQVAKRVVVRCGELSEDRTELRR